MNILTNIAHIFSVIVSLNVSISVYAYIYIYGIDTGHDVILAAAISGISCMLMICMGLRIIRLFVTPSVKNIICWGDIFIITFVAGILCFGIFLLLMYVGLGLIILNPILGWLSTLQNGRVLIAIFAGLGACLSIHVGVWLFFPILYLLNRENISTRKSLVDQNGKGL